MNTIETSSTSRKSLRGGLGDSRELTDLIASYRLKVSEIDRIRGELGSRKHRQDLDRESLKSKMTNLGIKSSKELINRLTELQNREDPSFFRIESEMETLYAEVRRLEGEKGVYEEEISKSEAKIRTCEADKERFEETLVFLREVSDTARSEIVSKFKNFVSQALEKIFGQDLLRFNIIITTKNHIPHAEFQIEDMITGQSLDVLESYGGGVADVVSIVLRLAVLEMQDPPNLGPVVLDEVGKFISDDYQERFGEFLKSWSKEFDRQIILVTHKPGILKNANRIFRVTKTDSVSVVDVVLNDEEKEDTRTQTLTRPRT